MPDKEKLTKDQHVLYRAFYCGICKTIKEEYGNFARFFTSYDMTFLAIVAHDMLSYPVEFVTENCVGHPFNKQAMIKPNPLLRKICAVQVILVKYKLIDDVNDGKRGRKKLLGFFRKQFDKARVLFPEAEKIVSDMYDKLREMEKSGVSGVDRVSDCFGSMLRSLLKLVVGEADEHALSLAYNTGKYVYIMDAADDLMDDVRKGNYNPFVAAYGTAKTRDEFFAEHGKDVDFCITSTVNRIIGAFNARQFNQSYSLIKNIVYYGLRKRADEVYNNKKPTRI